MVMLDALMVVKLEIGASDFRHRARCAGLPRSAAASARCATLCGRISRSTVDLGIAPFAGIGIALALFALATVANSYLALGACLFALGLFGGLFFLPFLAWMQKSTRPEEKGLILSTNNLLSMAGVLSASIALALLHDVLGLTPKAIFAVAGAVTLIYVATILFICPEIRSRLVVFADANSFHPSATTTN